MGFWSMNEAVDLPAAREISLAQRRQQIFLEDMMQRVCYVEVVGEPERARSNFVRDHKALPARVRLL